MAQATGKINKDMPIGEVIKIYPEATKVIEKYFGNGCFTCPGIKMESLSFGAMMHGKKVDVIVDEINKLLEKS